MTPSTDVDERGRMAAEELRSAVQDLHVPDTRRHPAPRKRRFTLALAALVLIGMVITAVALRDDDPTKVTTGAPGVLPLLVPTYVPDGGAVYRPEQSPPQGFRLTTAVFASTPRVVRGRGELLINVNTIDAGDFSNDGGVEATVNGHAARLYEYPVDNDQTLRIVMWIEEARTSVVVTSTTMDDDAILAASEELRIVDGAVANQTVAGLSLVLRRSSADAHETRTVSVRGGRPGQFLHVNISRTSAVDTADWLPGRKMDVRGYDAWMAHQPFTGSETNRSVVTISWLLSPDMRVSVFATDYSDDEALRVARSLREVSQSEWDALPTN